ncbi:hypothetical protein PRIPAC_77989, partial [Pristionchus pacificus]|uniref:G protein-coupled receptor n=1 Tax=Pristionchus pacificus TaxID=54126 RepID=A0A2A6CJA8_PRIPA
PGIFVNAFLLYLIKRFSRRELGGYKYLLAIFATYDIFLIVMHAVIDLRAVISDDLFGVISFNFLDTSLFTSLYGACFMVPFSLLNIHFLYRYWVIRSPHMVILFTKFAFIFLLITCVSTITTIWFCICEFGLDTSEEGYFEASLKLASKFNRSSIDGWFVFQRDGAISLRSIGTLLSYDVIMVIMCAISINLAIRTFLEIRAAKTISFSDRTSQLRILFTVCVQTAVPFLFVYCPFLCFFNLSLFGFRTPTFAADAAPYIHSIFPMLDALVIILLMKDYRNGARFLLFGARNERVICVANTTYSSQSSDAISARPTHF